MVKLEAEQIQSILQSTAAGTVTSNGTKSDDSTVILSGQKRKSPDDDGEAAADEGDVNAELGPSNGCNGTHISKRTRTDNIGSNANDLNQHSVNDDIGDDNRNNQQNGIATRENGKQAIDSNEAFQQGYVVVIPCTIHFWLFQH